MEQIGKGVQFTLYKVESKIDGKIYVIKKVRACMLHTPENRELHWNISSDCSKNYLIITTLLKYNKVYGLEVDEIKGYIWCCYCVHWDP